MERLDCTIQRYAWGSTTAIPALLGVEPDGTPQAELWVGAHPAAPSHVRATGASLEDVIAADPVGTVGAASAGRFGPRLPYLLKVLAAGAPLSIQAHPTDEQARAGFDREEAAGVPLDAPTRLYRDPWSKPEIIIALGPFRALCGIRPASASLELLGALGIADQAPFDRLLADGPGATIARVLRGEARVPSQEELARCEHPDAPALAGIARAWPDDPGVLVAALMHQVTLAAGEALFLPAGNLHAYLEGTGVEVMSSSDNVLRGGLTPKHVDVDELLAVLDATPGPPPSFTPTTVRPGVVRYAPDTPSFAVDLVTMPEAFGPVGPAGVPRLVLVLEGSLQATTGGSNARVLRPGEAAWVPASDGALALSGHGRAVVVQPGPLVTLR